MSEPIYGDELLKAYKGDLVISATKTDITVTKDGVSYQVGRTLPIGTYTIVATPQGSATLSSLEVNGETFVSGDTITVIFGSNINIVAVSEGGIPEYDRVFGNNTPDVISQISNEISQQGYTSSQVATEFGWNLGDLVNITLKNNKTIQMQIIGINHDTLSSDHTSKAGITLQMKDLLATNYVMNNDNTNAGGWAASKMRTSTIPTLLALLPDEWQAVIKNVDKKTANGGSSNYSATNTTSESLFLLSEIEILGSVTYAQDGANEGSQYEFYDNGGSKIKNFNGSASIWWERSSHSGGTTGFCMVGSGGNASVDNAFRTRGVAYAFCV